MVMATGIVSLAAELHGLRSIALGLFSLNLAAWATLVVLHALRLARYPARFLGDAADHLRAPGFFTSVAGTSVLASQCLVFVRDERLAIALGAAALGLWAVLTYGILTALSTKEEKPSLDKGLHGGWLLAVVATQSVAVLGALLAARAPAAAWSGPLNFLALSAWLFGGMLYVWIISLIFYRYTFFRLSPGDLTPPYWINMGAMAISTLAGAQLVANAAHAPFLASILPFLKGFTVLYWATGTWWVPMLLLLGVWRYVYKRFPLKYDVLYWGAVFPLGMYSASTHEMARVLGLEFLGFVPPLFLAAALAAWAAAAAGLAGELFCLLRRA